MLPKFVKYKRVPPVGSPGNPIQIEFWPDTAPLGVPGRDAQPTVPTPGRNVPPKCECGATKCGSAIHSSYCPLS